MEEVLAQFEVLDADGSGVLNKEDLAQIRAQGLPAKAGAGPAGKT